MQKTITIGSRQRINKSDITTQQAAQEIIKYIDEGFTQFDTADHYADGEDILWHVNQMLDPRTKEKTLIATKRVPNAWPIQANETQKAIDRSLQRLQTPKIDLLQFHDRAPDEIHGIHRLTQLQEEKNNNRIQRLWLTNASTPYIQKALQESIAITSNQICYSLLAQRPSSDMLTYCQKNNIDIFAFWTVAGWFLSEKRLNRSEPSIDQLQNASLKKYKRFIDIAGWREYFQELLQTLDAIAKSYQVSIATIASNYILYTPGISSIIIGARLWESEHREENKKILTVQLSEQERKKIHTITQQANNLPWDFGDEYRIDHRAYGWWHESLTSTGKSGYAGHQNKYIK